MLPINLNMYLLTVYNHMDAVIMCCDWDPDPPNTLESFVFLSKLRCYIITMINPDDVWLVHSRGGMLFSGGKFTEVSVRRADRRSDFFSKTSATTMKQWKETNTWWVKVFCWQVVFQAEMWCRVTRTDRRTDRRTGAMTVTLLLLFGHVTLLCGTFKWTCLRSALPAYPFTQVRFSSATTSDTTSRGASESQRNFTLCCIQNSHTEEDAESWQRISTLKRQCEKQNWSWVCCPVDTGDLLWQEHICCQTSPRSVSRKILFRDLWCWQSELTRHILTAEKVKIWIHLKKLKHVKEKINIDKVVHWVNVKGPLYQFYTSGPIK